MKYIGLVFGLLIIVTNCQNRRCKTVVECFTEAIETVQSERDELRQTVENSGPNSKNIMEEVRKGILNSSLQDKD